MRVRPNLPVLFTTGYTQNAVVHGGRLDPGVRLITKPFTRVALAARLREAIDPTRTPGRILLVEDEVLVRVVAAQMLSDAGFLIDEAGNVGEALAKARSLGARLPAVILDLNLPDRPGEDLAADLRALKEDLPLVIVSGHIPAEQRHRLAALPGVVLVAKPYLAPDLLGALSTLGWSRTRRRRRKPISGSPPGC